jgi:hypothetical protein
MSRVRSLMTAAPFRSLDFIYTPSADVATELVAFEDVLGARVRFAIDGMGARVAAVELAEGGPQILFADHLEGERPVLVFRVDDLAASLAALEGRGWTRERSFEIPHGPCCAFTTPGGHRLALYQLTRPEVAEHFEGRRDF